MSSRETSQHRSRSNTTLYSPSPQQTTSRFQHTQSRPHAPDRDRQSAQSVFRDRRPPDRVRFLQAPALSCSCSYESTLRAANKLHEVRNILIVDLLELTQRILNRHRRSEQQLVSFFQGASLLFRKAATPETHAVHT